MKEFEGEENNNNLDSGTHKNDKETIIIADKYSPLTFKASVVGDATSVGNLNINES